MSDEMKGFGTKISAEVYDALYARLPKSVTFRALCEAWAKATVRMTDEELQEFLAEGK